MVPLDQGPDWGIFRLLRGLPRESAPDLPLDAVFERWEHGRRRSFAFAGVAIAAVLIAAVLLQPTGLFWPSGGDPPVHLDLRIIDVTEEGAAEDGIGEDGFGADDEPLAVLEDRPRELRGP